MMSELEEKIEEARNQPLFNGMGSVHITFNPYLSEWTCKFNWSNNIPIFATHIHFEDAILNAIDNVEKAVKSKKNENNMLNTVNLVEINDAYRININQLMSFNDDRSGNLRIEEEFKKIIKKRVPGITEKSLDVYVCDGFYEDGEYWLGICNSKIE